MDQLTETDYARFLDTRRSLTHQKPTDKQVEMIERLRESFIETASAIYRSSLHSRERSLAITRLEDSLMWAVKAIVLGSGR